MKSCSSEMNTFFNVENFLEGDKIDFSQVHILLTLKLKKNL